MSKVTRANYAKQKTTEWNRYRNTHPEADRAMVARADRVASVELHPLTHRCDRCHMLNLTGVVCPDCALKRSILFSELYDAVPDTEQLAVPRSQRGRYISPVKGVRMEGYPHDYRTGQPKRGSRPAHVRGRHVKR